jgi:hypothetical protein
VRGDRKFSRLALGWLLSCRLLGHVGGAGKGWTID